MPKPAVRELIKLRRELDKLEADVIENQRQVLVTSPDAITELGTQVGEERLVKAAGETWRLRHEPNGTVRVIPQLLDEDV